MQIRKHNTGNKFISTSEAEMTKQARVISDGELDKLLSAAASTKHPVRNRVVLLLTHLAGMRIGEVAAVRVCDVLNKQGEVLDQIQLAAAQTKGNKGRTVLLNRRMQEELRYYLRTIIIKDVRQPLFATQRSKGFTANSLTQIVNGLYKRAGMTGCSSHSGRRGFLTNLAEKGVSVRVLMALAGHANLSSTQKYLDLRPGVLRNAVELI